MAWWTVPAIATGVSALLGYKSNKDAQKTQKDAINQQAGIEAQKNALIGQQLNLSDQLLHGVGYVPGEGVNAKPGQGGAMELSKQWTDDYLSWLKDSPDLTYNAQRGAMEGQIRDSMSQAARSLGQRGLNTANVQSGAALKTMGDIGMARAGMLSQMEAGRFDRQGQRLGMGTQLTQGLMDRALNMRNAAMGSSLNMQSQIPQMQMGLAGQQAAQAGAFGSLTGTMLDYLMQSRQPSVQIPTTVPMAGGSNIPAQTSQFYSFKQPPNAVYQPRTYWGS